MENAARLIRIRWEVYFMREVPTTLPSNPSAEASPPLNISTPRSIPSGVAPYFPGASITTPLSSAPSKFSTPDVFWVSVLAGECGEKFMQSCPVKCANEDAADCDSRMLDASWLWCDYSCLPQSHWKDGLAETGKRREFLVSNS